MPWPRNPAFTGRAEDLARLHRHLQQGPAVVTHSGAALTGLGGIGKTQTALEYAYRHHPDYALLWWLEAETEAGLEAGFARLADALGLTLTDRSAQAVRAAVLAHLQGRNGWLLVFDNAPGPAAVTAWLPKLGGGRVLITSRATDWERIARPVALDTFTREEAVEFLLTRTGRSDEACARDLARELGDLPLALEQAAAYVRGSRLSFAQYLVRYRKAFAQVMARGVPQDHPAAVATTWDLSVAEATRRCPRAADLLNLLAFLAADDIPRSLLAANVGGNTANPFADPLVLDDAIAALRGVSLLRVDEDGEALSLHRLVQAATRARLTEPLPVVRTALHLLCEAFPHNKDNRPDDALTWPVCARLRPHAEAALAALPADTTDQHGDFLLNQMGLYLKCRGDHAPAWACYQRALAMKELRLGPDHPAVATGLSNLANLLSEMGEATAAQPLLERALRIDEAALGPDHPNVAIRLVSLGYAFEALGQASEARPLYERALAIDQAVLGPDHPEVAIDLNNLANILRELGDVAAARPLAERALAIDRGHYGPDHPMVASNLHTLAGVLAALGEVPTALTHQRRALAILQRWLPPEHPHLRRARDRLTAIEARAAGAEPPDPR